MKWTNISMLLMVIGAVLICGCTSQPQDKIETATAKETEKQKTSTVGVSVEHITMENYDKDLSKIEKEGVLYLCKTPYDLMPVGMLFLNKDKWSGLEFEFEGIHFTNVQVKPNENGRMEITGNAEASNPSDAAVLAFNLLSSSEISSSELYEKSIGGAEFWILDENEDGVKDGLKPFKGVISGTSAQQNNGEVIFLSIRKL